MSFRTGVVVQRFPGQRRPAAAADAAFCAHDAAEEAAVLGRVGAPAADILFLKHDRRILRYCWDVLTNQHCISDRFVGIRSYFIALFRWSATNGNQQVIGSHAICLSCHWSPSVVRTNEDQHKSAL